MPFLQEIFQPFHYRINSEISIVIIQACIVSFLIGIWLAIISYRAAWRLKSESFFWCGSFSIMFSIWNLSFLYSYTETDLEIWRTSFSHDLVHRSYLALSLMLPLLAHSCFRSIYQRRYLISGKWKFLLIGLAILCFTLPGISRWQFFSILIGFFTFFVLGILNLRIWRDYLKSEDLRQKTRSFFLGLGLSVSILFSLIGQLRAESLTHWPLPYLGNLITLVFVYFVYQVIQSPRLGDIRELMLRGIRVVLLTFLLGGVFISLLIWVGEDNPELFFFNTFLASFIIVSSLDPLRKQVDRFVLKKFIINQHELENIVQGIRRKMRKARSISSLTSTLISGILDSDRIYRSGLFLWDASLNQYKLQSKNKFSGLSHLASDHPAIEYFRKTKAPFLQEKTETFEGKEILESLRSHYVFPLYEEDQISGLWCIRTSLSKTDLYSNFNSFELDLLRQLSLDVSGTLEELQHYQQQDRQQRLAALGEMSAALAHEIRNPLGAIRGATELLETSPTIQTEEDQECIEILKSEIERLEQTVNQYLHFARKTEQMIEVSLTQLIKKALMGLRGKALKTKTEIEFEETMTRELVLMTDPLKLEQVITNLVINACEAFSPKVWIELRARREAEQDFIEILIRDNGPGIAPPVLRNIFTPLFTTKSAGSGLGLPICKKIVDSLGGELGVESQVGEGTQFSIRFKLASNPVGPLN